MIQIPQRYLQNTLAEVARFDPPSPNLYTVIFRVCANMPAASADGETGLFVVPTNKLTPHITNVPAAVVQMVDSQFTPTNRFGASFQPIHPYILFPNESLVMISQTAASFNLLFLFSVEYVQQTQGGKQGGRTPTDNAILTGGR